MSVTVEDSEKRLLGEHEKVTEGASEPTVIATYGRISELENGEQRQNRLNNLDEIGKRCTDARWNASARSSGRMS